MWRRGGTAATGMLVSALLMTSAPAGAVSLVGARQSACGTSAFCPADPAPDAGDQATAEQKIKDGYIQKQINCTPSLPPNPQSITWDPPGFAPNVGGSGVIRDANPQLGGQYRADYVNGRWHIEYPYC
ncbi:integrase [Mycobacterium sp. IEC1808]|uniref:integrase n=1 Tax=Mycobacterium sp. IEC1808 TaxID=1743230 RepID=UPI000A16A858|nr:integrase [Mycobacterium sp. IEC1808]ORW96457.1 integrase [Mycobacterium sp. IEC1808]